MINKHVFHTAFITITLAFSPHAAALDITDQGEIDALYLENNGISFFQIISFWFEGTDYSIMPGERRLLMMPGDRLPDFGFQNMENFPRIVDPFPGEACNTATQDCRSCSNPQECRQPQQTTCTLPICTGNHMEYLTFKPRLTKMDPDAPKKVIHLTLSDLLALPEDKK